jgi:cell division protein FtsL
VTKLQLLLLAVLIACALGVVTSQHRARKLFVELQKEKDRAQQMEVEWGQLQLEQSTWAMPARVEKIASVKLQMQLPKSSQIQFIRSGITQGGQPGGVIPQP